MKKTTTAALLLVAATTAATTASAQQRTGAQVYAQTCAACHQPTGLGKEEQYPPLAGSEWVTGPDARLVRIILHGLTGEIDVEGQTFSGLMPPWGPTLTDADIAAVATYVRSSFGNKAAPVSVATVAAIRKSTATRSTPWTAADLAKVLQVSK